MTEAPYLSYNNLVGKVCVCSLGRPGLVVKMILHPDGYRFWAGIGFDGKGLWLTHADTPTVVIANSITEYYDMIVNRPGNVLYATAAVNPPGAS